MVGSRNCYFCKYYKDEYCENLELKPCYPQKGCEDFSKQNELKGDVEEIIKAESVLDKIRAEIIEKYWDCDICKYNGRFNIRGDISDILQIIDKYKDESEEE